MDAFDEILNRTPEVTKQKVSKNLAIAVRIADVLKEQGKTQRDLARLLDKSESEISRWLTGLHNLELKTIYKIEAVLETDIISVTPNEPTKVKGSTKEKSDDHTTNLELIFTMLGKDATRQIAGIEEAKVGSRVVGRAFNAFEEDKK